MKTRTKARSCTGKRRFATRQLAVAEEYRRVAWYDVYRCKFCEGWHLGHHKPGWK